MDLLALLFKNNVLEILRISYKIKKIFTSVIEK
jgi:hypothetical protein